MEEFLIIISTFALGMGSGYYLRMRRPRKKRVELRFDSGMKRTFHRDGVAIVLQRAEKS